MASPKNLHGKRMYDIGYLVETVITVTLEKHHNGGTNEKNNTKDALKIKMKTIPSGNI